MTWRCKSRKISKNNRRCYHWAWVVRSRIPWSRKRMLWYIDMLWKWTKGEMNKILRKKFLQLDSQKGFTWAVRREIINRSYNGSLGSSIDYLWGSRSFVWVLYVLETNPFTDTKHSACCVQPKMSRMRPVRRRDVESATLSLSNEQQRRRWGRRSKIFLKLVLVDHLGQSPSL